MTDNNGIMNVKNFWIQNSCLTYERVYLTIPGLLVEIGGFSKIILTIADLLNKILYRYKTLIDIEKILITKEERLKSKFGEQKSFSLNKIISQNRENSRKSAILNNNFFNTQIYKGLENNKNNEKTFNENIINKENNLILNTSQEHLKNIKNNHFFSTNISKFQTDNSIDEKISSKLTFFDFFNYLLFANVNKNNNNQSHYQYIHIIFQNYKKIISEENIINVYYFLKNINQNLDIYQKKKKN
jgi:hypothetical protein